MYWVYRYETPCSSACLLFCSSVASTSALHPSITADGLTSDIGITHVTRKKKTTHRFNIFHDNHCLMFMHMSLLLCMIWCRHQLRCSSDSLEAWTHVSVIIEKQIKRANTFTTVEVGKSTHVTRKTNLKNETNNSKHTKW